MRSNSRGRWLARAAIAGLLFAAGVVLGVWHSVERRAADFAAGVDQRLREKGSNQVASSPLPASLANGGGEDETLAAIMTAIADDEPLRRSFLLRQSLATLNSAEL